MNAKMGVLTHVCFCLDYAFLLHFEKSKNIKILSSQH